MRQLPLASLLCASLLMAAPLYSYEAQAADQSQPSQATEKAEHPQDKAVTTEHRIKVNGDTLKYQATIGNMIIKDDKNQPSASVFYVAYTMESKKDQPRPVTFVFNGGPGSSSLWLHMGSFGPVRVETTNAAPTPPAPYKLLDNQYTLLDSTDLVFIDAFDTGFSRGITTADAKDKAGKDENPAKKFFGVDEDADGFARFITRYVTVNNRWNSPKYLLGESYGTVRAPVLANQLQQDGMAFNGVILVSSILNYGANAPGLDRQYVGLLPTFAAVAYYHNKLPNKPAELASFLQQVRAFAEGEFAQALAAGHNLPAAELDKVAEQLHQYTGLSTEYLKHANLQVGQAQFRKELLRDEERTMGRYDGRFTGMDKDAIGETPDTDPSDTAPSAAFVATFNDYLSNQLNYHPDDTYRVFSFDAFRNWDWQHDLGRGHKSRSPYVVDDLGNAIRTNPSLQVFSANGYFDMATPFHATEYDLAHMELDPSLIGNVHFGYYPSGHMIYLNPEALKSLHKDLENFYKNTQHQ